jgi:hypothetical protein
MRLEAGLADDVDVKGAPLGVAVTRDCGAVAVTISGRTGGLKLLFDRTEPPAFVRHVIRETVNRYKAGLGIPPDTLEVRRLHR